MTPRPRHHPYRRTPLPYSPTDGAGWTMLCWFAIIFSPFAGFWVHGRVDGRGVEIGLQMAIVPLAGLVYLYCPARIGFLLLHDGQHVTVARQREREPELLDAVRAIGRKPVRMFCDID